MQFNRTSIRCTRLALVVVTAVSCFACGADAPLPEQSIAMQSDGIVRGEASGAAQNAVVLLRIANRAECSGALVAPNLVLTARHCVSMTDETAACAADGRPLRGGRIFADYPAEDLLVYVGSRRANLVARARGAQVLHDQASNLCNHDLAFIVLDRAITDVPVAPLRLTNDTSAGEEITAVGWGLTAASITPVARMQRHHVRVLDVGPSQATARNELVVGEAICSGDSGGPALSASGAVIGVASHGGNGRSSASRPAISCIGLRVRNTYTMVAPFSALAREAFAEAGYAPRLEGTTL